MKYILRDKNLIQKEIISTQVPENTLAIWSLGQTGFLIKNSHKDIIAIDPYLTYTIEENSPDTEFKRIFPPVIDPEHLQGINGVLISHYHDDHMDMGTLTKLSKIDNKIPYYIPLPDAKDVQDQYDELSSQVNYSLAHKEIKIGNFKIKTIASSHDQYDFDKDGNSRYVGYFITCDNISLYHAGDAVLTKELREELKELSPDIMMLPINGGDFYRTAVRGILPNMTFRDAVNLFDDVQSDILFPTHFDMFPNNTDTTITFFDYINNTCPGKKFHLFSPGERFIYMK